MNDLMHSIKANTKDDAIFNNLQCEPDISMPELKRVIMSKHNVTEQEAKFHIQSALERGIIGLGKNLKPSFGKKEDLVC